VELALPLRKILHALPYFLSQLWQVGVQKCHFSLLCCAANVTHKQALLSVELIYQATLVLIKSAFPLL
jgi:hypothetical protein